MMDAMDVLQRFSLSIILTKGNDAQFYDFSQKILNSVIRAPILKVYRLIYHAF